MKHVHICVLVCTEVSGWNKLEWFSYSQCGLDEGKNGLKFAEIKQLFVINLKNNLKKVWTIEIKNVLNGTPQWYRCLFNYCFMNLWVDKYHQNSRFDKEILWNGWRCFEVIQLVFVVGYMKPKVLYVRDDQKFAVTSLAPICQLRYINLYILC